MKIKKELAMALLFSINAGILILAMCSKCCKASMDDVIHKFCNVISQHIFYNILH